MLLHLIELRRRILRVLVVFIVLFLLFFFCAPYLFHQVVSPLLKILPLKGSLIATQITTPLFVPIQLAMDAAMFCTAPYALLQIWLFVAPGLYSGERRRLQWAMISSLILFLMGVLFCFYVVLPFMLNFFLNAVPDGVRLMPDITDAVDFITRMLLLFGFSFQIPLLCVLMVSIGLVSVSTLKIIRPYVIVIAFILGMILTPPDVFSQILMAVPLCMLYELGIVFANLLLKQPIKAVIKTNS